MTAETRGQKRERTQVLVPSCSTWLWADRAVLTDAIRLFCRGYCPIVQMRMLRLRETDSPRTLNRKGEDPNVAQTSAP